MVEYTSNKGMMARMTKNCMTKENVNFLLLNDLDMQQNCILSLMVNKLEW